MIKLIPGKQIESLTKLCGINSRPSITLFKQKSPIKQYIAFQRIKTIKTFGNQVCPGKKRESL